MIGMGLYSVPCRPDDGSDGFLYDTCRVLPETGDHQYFTDKFGLRKRRLDVLGTDIFAAGQHNHVLLPPGYGKISIFVQMTQIAGEQPADAFFVGSDNRLGGFRILIVAFHNAGPAECDFTLCVGRQFLIVLVDDFDKYRVNGLAHRTQFTGLLVEAVHGRILRGAVSFVQQHSSSPEHIKHPPRHWCRAREEKPNLAPAELFNDSLSNKFRRVAVEQFNVRLFRFLFGKALFEVLCEHRKKSWHSHKDGDFLVLDKLGNLAIFIDVNISSTDTERQHLAAGQAERMVR